MSDSKELKQTIISALNVPAFFQQYLDNQVLKKDKADGWSHRLLCPIHGDKNTPNLFVNLITGSFKCQSCGAAGSAFDFWLFINGYDPSNKTNFPHALVALANEAGVDIEKFSRGLTSKPVKREDIAKSELPKHNKADAKDISETPIKKSVVIDFHRKLKPAHWKYLSFKRGLSKATVERFQIGWNDQCTVKNEETGSWGKGRYAIPVPNKEGEIRNIRQYSPVVSSQFKMINYVENKGEDNERRYGSPVRLLGLDLLIKHQWKNVVICEGEFDFLLLNQYFEENEFRTWGVVTGTHGANTFESEWIEYLVGRNVYLCLDCDEAGKAAAATIANQHFVVPMRAGRFESVRIVDLPLTGTKDDKDIGDFYLKREKTFEEFIVLCKETPELVAGGLTQDDATVEAVEVESLVEAVKDRRYIDKRITVPITISGATSKVYHAIREYKITKCPNRENSECCMNSDTTRVLPYGHPMFIESCMSPQAAVMKNLSCMACTKDQKVSVTATKKVVMEEYIAHQVIERWVAEEDEQGRMQNSQELTQTSIYILQPPDNMSIEPQNYMATGFIRTHPKTSIATLFVQALTPMEEDWQGFSLESKENKALIQEIKSGFTTEDIISDITNGVTRIYESDHILLAILLSYLSPLWIRFNGSRMRGWINCCIIGDSGTGKSETYLKFSDWIGVGDLFSALSGTRTGLLYAIKQKSGEWHVSIGRYVQSSGRIIAIDETQETPGEEIKRMAIAMDKGWLQIEQVASGGYHTQTRTIFIMNPKLNGADATLSDFAYGCDSMRQSFAPMFIRRLDVAVFVSRSHDNEFYNQKISSENKGTKSIRLSQSMMRALVYWAWTRQPDQVIWTDTATELCLIESTRLSEIYGYTASIPLVSPQDFRNNLARMSTAYAVLDRNFSEDLESVIVEPKHVTAMTNYVNGLYSSSECSLAQRSKHERQITQLEDYEKISVNFNSFIQNARGAQSASVEKFLQLLILLRKIQNTKKRDLQDQLNVNARWLSQQVSRLQGYDLVEFQRHGLKATNKFNKFMLRWESEPGVHDRLEIARHNIGRDMMRDEAEDSVFEEGGVDDYFSEYSPTKPKQDEPQRPVVQEETEALEDPFS